MVWFLGKTFLLANTSENMVLGMHLLVFSNTDFQFGAEKLSWRSYITAKALLTTSRVEFIDKKEFAKAALDENFETFILHVIILKVSTTILIHCLKIS